METYLYFSMTPESLIASMLAPEAFGVYLATGTKKRSHGEAIYFDLKKDFSSEYFDLTSIASRCVAHPDGSPKHSVYLSIYRVLEHVPLEAIGSLWLATRDGRVLELKPSGGNIPELTGTYHLYQEISPVHPLIATTLEPQEFCRFITDSSQAIHVPRICFVDLELSGLAKDPVHGDASDLPYADLSHIRDCLGQLGFGGKKIKTVNRTFSQEPPYRCVRSGFYVGDSSSILYFPFPAKEEMDRTYHDWWRSANV